MKLLMLFASFLYLLCAGYLFGFYAAPVQELEPSHKATVVMLEGVNLIIHTHYFDGDISDCTDFASRYEIGEHDGVAVLASNCTELTEALVYGNNPVTMAMEFVGVVDQGWVDVVYSSRGGDDEG